MRSRRSAGLMTRAPASATNSSENSPLKTGSAHPVSVTSRSGLTSTSSSPPSSSTVTGLRAPSSTAATAAPDAPVPRTASPPPRARRFAPARGHRRPPGRTTRWCGSGTARCARSAARSPPGPGSSSPSSTRIAHCGLPMLTCWNSNSRPSAVTVPRPSSPPDGKSGRAQPRAPHLHPARARGRDRRAHLAGRGLDRELVAVGPPLTAQVQDRLAHAVARQLRLRSVGIEDPQARDEALVARAATAPARRRSGSPGGRRTSAARARA